MEIDSRLMVESNCVKRLIKDCVEAESCMMEAAKGQFVDTEIRQCSVTDDGYGADDSGISTSMQVIGMDLDNKEVSCFSGSLQVEVVNSSELHSRVECDVKDVVHELEPCPEVQMKENGTCSELQQIHDKDVCGGAEMEPFAKSLRHAVEEELGTKNLVKESLQNDGVGVCGGAEMEPSAKTCRHVVGEELGTTNLVNESLNDAEVEEKEFVKDTEEEPCTQKTAPKSLDAGNVEPFPMSNLVKEEACDFDLEPCPKKEVKEASNDDIYSEVSNPDLPQKRVSSSMTVSSQPLDVHGSDHGACGEVTSACYRSSFADEQHNKGESESVSTSRVVLEIPKHLRPTGIRKITFKFRKRKEDYDRGLSMAKTSVHEIKSRVDGNELHGQESPFLPVPNKECKLMMSKKIIPDNYPTNVKRLLSTGILEGARVKYISVSGENEIPGIIKDCGYLCGCSGCNFSQVVNAYEFELHAGSKSRHPNNHIYLENGKPIYSVVEELQNAPLNTLDAVIKAVAGSSVNENYLQNWKAKLQYGNDEVCVDGASRSKHSGIYDRSTSYPSDATEDMLGHPENHIEVSTERKRLVKKVKHNMSGPFTEHKKAVAGGNKKRDNDLHKILFMPNGLPDGTSLAYYSKGKRILGGYKQGNGILCSCCNTEISPSQFESHAGWAVKRQPYRHIYTSTGITLHDLALMLSSGQNLTSIGSDDMCAVCGHGGELKMCNGCPRAFHAACLGLESITADDWQCSYCKDKIGPGRKASGEAKPIILRLKKVVKTPQYEPGGCIICRSQDFSAAKFDDRTVIICDQCEKEYHVGCLRESEMCDLKELPANKWFCCKDCNKIFTVLVKMSCSAPEAIPASVSAAVSKQHLMMGLNEEPNNEITWCILSGKRRFPDHLGLLSRAAQIFRECFDPIVAKSGRDLIPIMVYGRNISGQEFSGMYCVVLIVKSVVVSAGLLRIFGQEVAELPLVATDRGYQRKGYFRAMFSSIELFLSSMGVKQLVLPAAEEAESMWVNKLGFNKMSHEQMLKYTRDYQITMFKGTSLLEKDVPAVAD